MIFMLGTHDNPLRMTSKETHTIIQLWPTMSKQRSLYAWAAYKRRVGITTFNHYSFAHFLRTSNSLQWTQRNRCVKQVWIPFICLSWMICISIEQELSPFLKRDLQTWQMISSITELSSFAPSLFPWQKSAPASSTSQENTKFCAIKLSLAQFFN